MKYQRALAVNRGLNWRTRLVTTAAMAALSGVAHADTLAVSGASHPFYAQECSACHVAYPPGLLPAASWQRVMGTLNKHFGTDASLDDAKATREVTQWLVANAGTYRRVTEEPPNDRISQSAWFLRKHREGEVPAGVWKRASVGSPANCGACHPGASKGHFNEHDVRIPK